VRTFIGVTGLIGVVIDVYINLYISVFVTSCKAENERENHDKHQKDEGYSFHSLPPKIFSIT
jgi:hypothetical protein